MKRKFVIEFEVEDSDIKEWVEYEEEEAGEKISFTPVDLIASQWATGEGLQSLTVTRNEEVS
jgi:hypothetical protein